MRSTLLKVFFAILCLAAVGCSKKSGETGGGTGGEIVAVRPGERPPRFGSASQALVLWRPGLGRPSAPR